MIITWMKGGEAFKVIIQRISTMVEAKANSYGRVYGEPHGKNTTLNVYRGEQGGSTTRPEDLLVSIPIGHPDSMMSKESVRRAVEDFITTPTDIIVSTFPKTGTTLITWICHLLRTLSQHYNNNKEKNNNEIELLKLKIMNSFDTIYELCPWPTLCWDIGDDPNNTIPQYQGLPLSPRVYKSHLRMASIYPGCKYIVTVRDPSKTTLSFYNFFISKKVPFIIDTTNENNDNDKILMDVSTFLMDTPFIQGITTKAEPNQRASIWDYYIEYHQLLYCSDVLILIYEDIVQDMPQAIRQIGQFMNIINNDNDSDDDDGIDNDNGNDDDNLVSIIGSMTTKEYMSQYMSKFDEPYERACQLNRSADLSQLAPGNKIATVQQKNHPQTLNKEAQQFLRTKWNESLQPLGYNNYSDDFCTTIRNRNKTLFAYMRIGILVPNGSG
ncbi:P-loop containing nucleoside triphosphate hydrolase protein [Fragilariopsis cylindrus CCMP1102]|uniref:p-loop containing nucleoside triphosphate hydrolase protein n=1 Tax=Fragilariopsis cylindrus CCMP1102 TaxID=635003 RepID=A0A1E7F7S7_9STRA|nr:P-loop containing nucleoside triphosphate hydrolase protein [Fragilariopsis cylindrus CCMP1102]|eukprot:OEU14231.1 P-loop containing nucleoside triphosphate hydrolase protein [Fragilariopsis cylindrus CCMP1102]